MRKSWLLLNFVIVGLTACSSIDGALNNFSERGPASISAACNRQALGLPQQENAVLTQYNSKRSEVVAQLLKQQIERLKTKVSEETVQTRLQTLEARTKALAEGLHPWDEPNEVTYNLQASLELYLADIALDEKANLLSEAESKRLKYVRESVQPNLNKVDYWMSDFCKSTNGKVPAESFTNWAP